MPHQFRAASHARAGERGHCLRRARERVAITIGQTTRVDVLDGVSKSNAR